MNRLDADSIRQLTSAEATERIEQLDVLEEIDSTNNYLMQESAPDRGRFRVAATNNQSAGRGRFGKRWQSPPGSGVCLSVAYTFAGPPQNLPALTLAAGLAAVAALKGQGAQGVQLKWPNDLVASEGKLGGILTEVQPQQSEAVTVVVGIGINVDIGDVSDLFDQSAWALRTIDLRRICLKLPSHDAVAGALISELAAAVIKFEVSGFASFTSSWSDHDWLSGREVTLEINNKQVSGIASGIEEDGALLVATDNDGIRRVTSGSIVSVGPIGTAT